MEQKNIIETKCDLRRQSQLYVSHVCKRILDSNFKQLFTKYRIFMILPQISHIYKNRYFLGTIVTIQTAASL